jgi:hypothetical protein
MSKAVVYTGADPTHVDDDNVQGEWEDDEDVADVTVRAGVTEIKLRAFLRCKGLTNLSFLQGSSVTTVGGWAFERSGIASLQGMKGVRMAGFRAFAHCKDLRTIEGLGCEEMGHAAASPTAPCCSR